MSGCKFFLCCQELGGRRGHRCGQSVGDSGCVAAVCLGLAQPRCSERLRTNQGSPAQEDDMTAMLRMLSVRRGTAFVITVLLRTPICCRSAVSSVHSLAQ